MYTYLSWFFQALPLSSSSSDSSDDTFDEFTPMEPRSKASGSVSEEDLVSELDTSLDSDEPLSVFAQRLWQLKAQGTNKFKCWKQYNSTWQKDFVGYLGVNVPGLDAFSSPVEIYHCFVKDEPIEGVGRGTNW